jgi:two-component system sensor histidine kinase RegB
MVEPGVEPGAAGGRNQTNLRWLLRLRWGALGGQILTILIVRFVMDLAIPIAPLAALLAFDALTNALWHLIRRRDPGAPVSDRAIGATMVLDVLVLSGLLYFTGGADNPFSFLYLVLISLAAVILTSTWTWALVALSLAASAILFFWHRPLDLGESHAAHMRLHLRGMWIAFGVAAAFIVYFLRRVSRALAEREAELEVSRNLVARQERLAALATLAAGAAHELSTPLGTIALVAKELEREVARLGSPDQLADDVRLVRAQVDRCRAILERMCVDAGEMRGEGFVPATVRELVDASLTGLTTGSPIRAEIAPDLEGVSLRVPARAISEAIRGVLKNAQEASSPSGAPVKLLVRRDDHAVAFAVEDRGPGMPAAVLDRVGEPFFTTKPIGQGMGLGLFLARAVLERVGGSLSFDSMVGRGTTAVLRVPLGEGGG